MSWMPAQDPILGDKRTCDALDLIIVPRVRDLGGGFSVHRALPHAKRQMVGPFIFAIARPQHRVVDIPAHRSPNQI
jgi:hypothetical protein